MVGFRVDCHLHEHLRSFYGVVSLVNSDIIEYSWHSGRSMAG